MLKCWPIGWKKKAEFQICFWCQRSVCLSVCMCVCLAVFVLCKASGSGCLWNLRCLVCSSLASCSGKVDQPFFSSCTWFFQCHSQKNSAGIHVRRKKSLSLGKSDAPPYVTCKPFLLNLWVTPLFIPNPQIPLLALNPKCILIGSSQAFDWKVAQPPPPPLSLPNSFFS